MHVNNHAQQKKINMTIQEYEKQFSEILNGENGQEPYNEDEYLNYVMLNQSRIKRWNKTGQILPELVETIENIKQPQSWLLITEPWCGDAANSHAFIGKLAALNSKINLTFQNRDAANSEIDQYLTNGGRAIPKLIVRDEEGNDLFDWGPRPKEAQALMLQLKEDDSVSDEDKKIALQKWYNKDKGVSLQQELIGLFKANFVSIKHAPLVSKMFLIAGTKSQN